MKKIYTDFIFLFPICILFGFAACESAPDLLRPKQGNLNLSNYIAIGDGYSAGFTNTHITDPNSDKGLYTEGQLSSFPQLLVNQFNQASQLTFFESGLLSETGSGYFELEKVLAPNCPENELAPILTEIEGSSNWYAPVGDRKINNLSVPRLRLAEIEKTSVPNAFLQRFKSDSSQTYLSLIEESAPSFFTLSIGSRDIVDHAIRGAADPAYPLLSVADFSKNYAKILNTLFLNHPDVVRGVVGHIPDISEFPFFTSTKPSWKDDEDNCNNSAHPLYIETSSNYVRFARETDRILLPASYLLGQYDIGREKRFGLSEDYPIPKDLVLDNQEVTLIKEQISIYNTQIDSIVQDFNNLYEEERISIAKVDVLVKGLTIGLIEDGIDINNTYLSGGFFSLDGLYLTPRGNAMVANEFVKAINQNKDFEALISPLNLISYTGVVFP